MFLKFAKMSNFINASQEKHVKVKNEQFFTNWRAKIPPLASKHNHFKQTSNNNDVHQKSFFFFFFSKQRSKMKLLICNGTHLPLVSTWLFTHPPFRHVKPSRSGFPSKGCRTGDLYRSPRTFSLLTCPAHFALFPFYAAIDVFLTWHPQ